MKDILIYVIEVLFAGILGGTVSYAWFSVNERIRKLEDKLNELERGITNGN